MTFVSELEPRQVWRHFDEILKIPRGSGNEQGMRDYVIGIAKKHGLGFKQDKTGNVVVSKPAANGRDRMTTIVLQSHLDMVNEKNSEVQHNFNRDAIQPRLEGEYLKATGTTLGSDNGIGVAASLAMMESNEVKHGPLEFLFTVDEETGLTGANSLAEDMLAGRHLINLDTEEEGALYVGCAGGGGSEILFPLKKTPASKDQVALQLKLTGLRGGHSGVDIHLQRGNANKLLARVLYRILQDHTISFKLAGFFGGNKHNAIPREAFAVVQLPRKQQHEFEQALQAQTKALQMEYQSVEPALAFSTSPAKAKETWSGKTTARVLALLQALPHGVMMMSNDIPGLVETSTNLAIVEMKKKALRVHCSTRSSVASALQSVKDQVRAIAEAFGAEVGEVEGYPGWKPDLNSKVLAVANRCTLKFSALSLQSRRYTPAWNAASSVKSIRAWIWSPWARKSRIPIRQTSA